MTYGKDINQNKQSRGNKIMKIIQGIRFKDFLEEAEKEKKELAKSYKESKRQTKERTDVKKLKEKNE